MSAREGSPEPAAATASVSRYAGVGLWRRALDVVAAGVCLMLLAPLLVVVAVAVKLTSPGPVLFRQTRLGGGRREFTILKFRTMTVHHGGPEVTAIGDSRITTVGSFLRRTHFDELPQLVNVLRGHMTLVGPRPETPALAARYPREHQWVLDHRPGLTGPTQVRERDFNTIPAAEPDPEQWYLEHLVPQRVVMDATYLNLPTITATLRVLLDTAHHLVTTEEPHPHRPATS